jgi:hypothetical protein
MRGLAEIVRLRTADCRQVAPHLAVLAAGEPDDQAESAAAHVASCLRCQAEVAAYQRLRRSLRGLRHDVIAPPPGALAAVLAALEAAAAEEQSATWTVRAAYVGGITVATAAAGAAGVLVWMNRRRVGVVAAAS